MARNWGTVVVGGGPVGLVAALAAARREATLLMAGGGPGPGPPRLDVVPAPFLALLLEFGVHPAALGVRELHDTRLVAWKHAEPEVLRGPATAHIERSALERALAGLVGREPRIERAARASFPPPSASRLVVDATGRRAVSARCLVRPAEPWIARSFWSSGGFPTAAQVFRIAALPGGYAYRLGNATRIMLGTVGAESEARRQAHEIEQELRAQGAGWLLAGLPPLRTMQPGRGGVASAQWSAGGTAAVRVGDADLARDALASQGLATGVSDALHLLREGEGPGWAERRREQRERHVSSLLATIASCRFRHLPAWSRYTEFLAGQASA